MVKKNYRNRHFFIVGWVLYMILGQILSFIFPVHTKLVNFILMVLWCFLLCRYSGPIEKGDELTKENINKATGITFWIVMAFIILSAVIGENIENHTALKAFASDVYFYIFFSAIGLRSIIFLVLDRTPSCESEDE